jgi:hypothetical protein
MPVVADQIIVLEHGNPVDAGTHEELLARPGTHRELWGVQQLAEAEQSSRKGRTRTLRKNSFFCCKQNLFAEQ